MICFSCEVLRFWLSVLRSIRRGLERKRMWLLREVTKLQNILNQTDNASAWLILEANTHLVPETPRGEWSYNKAVVEIATGLRLRIQINE